MPFTTEDFHDLVRLVETHPEWRGELRRLVLSEELLALPEQLAALRARSEEQFHTLVEAQQHTEERLDALTVRVDTLTGQMSTLTTQVTALVQAVQTLTDDVGALKGMSLEMHYRFKGPSYFGRMLRRSHVLTSDELTALLEDAREHGLLSDAQTQEIYDADLVVRGRRAEERSEVYLVVEISWGVGIHDVQRATQRASLMSRTGVRALPVVAGKWVSPDAQRLAHLSQVWQLTGGLVVAPSGDET